jgi:Ni/Fe-hydrogenase 1 B-type cytochrome subunit
MEAVRGPARPWPTEREPVYVWDVIVRVTHWVIVLSMVLLTVTGIYIGNPFASGKFVMGWMKILHFYGAIAFSLAVVSRVVWMFVGPRRSGWRQFIPTSPRRRRGLLESLKFYLFMRNSPPDAIGHNPLAGLTYVGVFGLYFVMILTGFALYSQSSYSYMGFWSFLLTPFGGAQWARWIHHGVMWALIAFAIHHVYSALLTAMVERNGTIDSIFSGYKFLRRDRKGDDDEE